MYPKTVEGYAYFLHTLLYVYKLIFNGVESNWLIE